jgi:hypothetical protein
MRKALVRRHESSCRLTTVVLVLSLACNAILLLLLLLRGRTVDLSGSSLGPDAVNDDKKMQDTETSKPLLPSFLQLATKTGTDKTLGHYALQVCRKDRTKNGSCRFPNAINPSCRPGAQHFYDTIYDKYLQNYIIPQNTVPFQFVEIGFYLGSGFEAYTEYIVPNAPPNTELHSIEAVGECGFQEQELPNSA